MKYIPLFVLIQLVNIPLMVMGWFICLVPHLPEMTGLWWNTDDDVLIEKMPYWQRYVYLAWRNPVANLRHVPGVSKVGRPLYYRTFTLNSGTYGASSTMVPKEFYVKLGWMSDGYPACSAGSGRGY